jgi:hypothetical protein
MVFHKAILLGAKRKKKVLVSSLPIHPTIHKYQNPNCLSLMKLLYMYTNTVKPFSFDLLFVILILSMLQAK